MRRTVYQQAENPEVMLAAADIRRRFRPGLGAETCTRTCTQAETEVEATNQDDTQPMAAE